MLERMPNEESRAIGVINKCDTKQKKSNDFVIIAFEHSDRKIYLRRLGI